jgi:hypothetical protein
MGFPQRGLQGTRIGRFPAAPGKANLTGMYFHVFRSFYQAGVDALPHGKQKHQYAAFQGMGRSFPEPDIFPARGEHPAVCFLSRQSCCQSRFKL